MAGIGMRKSLRLRAVVVMTVVALVVSCATTRLSPISSTGTEFQPLKDERKLWERAREEESKLRDNAHIYDDPLLESYLEEVVGGLNTPGMAANPALSYRVHVIDEPTLNAFAFPHGSLYVHTGILARMENESQLATVLAHEMTHVENRHMLRFQRSVRNKQIGFSIAAIAAAVIIAEEEGDAVAQGDYGKAARYDILGDLLVGLGLQLAIIASVNGYGRDLEREADSGGLSKLTAAGYDVNEAPKVYQTLLEDQGDSSRIEAFFFGSHPRLASRVENTEQWIDEHPGQQGTPRAHDPERFLRRIRPVIRDDARSNIELGRLELAASQLQRVWSMMPDDPGTHTLLGKLKLEQSKKEQDPAARRELRDQAAAAFREAIRLDPDRPTPHRELGLLAYAEDDMATACVQFRQYIELDPDEEEVERIRDYVVELARDDDCP